MFNIQMLPGCRWTLHVSLSAAAKSWSRRIIMTNNGIGKHHSWKRATFDLSQQQKASCLATQVWRTCRKYERQQRCPLCTKELWALLSYHSWRCQAGSAKSPQRQQAELQQTSRVSCVSFASTAWQALSWPWRWGTFSGAYAKVDWHINHQSFSQRTSHQCVTSRERTHAYDVRKLQSATAARM